MIEFRSPDGGTMLYIDPDAVEVVQPHQARPDCAVVVVSSSREIPVQGTPPKVADRIRSRDAKIVDIDEPDQDEDES